MRAVAQARRGLGASACVCFTYGKMIYQSGSGGNGAHLRRVPRAPRIRIPRLRVPRRLTRTLAWSTRLAHSPRWQKGLRRGRCRTHNAHGRRPCGFLSPGSSTERRPRPESMLIRGTRNDAALFLCLISKLLAGARSSTTQAGIRTECYLTT